MSTATTTTKQQTRSSNGETQLFKNKGKPFLKCTTRSSERILILIKNVKQYLSHNNDNRIQSSVHPVMWPEKNFLIMF